MNNILLISCLISLFCIGLTLITSKKMIGYFLRYPYDLMSNKRDTRIALIKNQKEKVSQAKEALDAAIDGGMEGDDLTNIKNTTVALGNALTNMRLDYQNYIRLTGVAVYILKPIIGCGVCMASVWTIVWYPFFEWYSLDTVLAVFIVAALNGLILAPYELIVKQLKK